MRLYYADALPLPQLYMFHRRKGVKKLARKLGVKNIDIVSGKDSQTWTLTPTSGNDPSIAIVLYEPVDGITIEEECALMAHEAVHIVGEIYSGIGEDRPGSEETAYLVQSISQALTEGNRIWRSKHA